MSNTWEFQDAKTKLSEVVRLAERQPQIVCKHGQPFVVVISIEEYQKYLEWQNSEITVYQALMPKNGGILTDEEVDALFKRASDNRLREIDFE